MEHYAWPLDLTFQLVENKLFFAVTFFRFMVWYFGPLSILLVLLLDILKGVCSDLTVIQKWPGIFATLLNDSGEAALFEEISWVLFTLVFQGQPHPLEVSSFVQVCMVLQDWLLE